MRVNSVINKSQTWLFQIIIKSNARGVHHESVIYTNVILQYGQIRQNAGTRVYLDSANDKWSYQRIVTFVTI